MELFDAGATYAKLLEEAPLAPVAFTKLPDSSALAAMQRGFGYTREDVKMILQPMAVDGKDAVYSMGDDTPLAFLARAPRPVYAYFRQRFAQVTNPAIDPLREACVVSLHTRIGPWAHLLDKNAALPGLSLASPFLSLGQVEALRKGEYPHLSELPMAELACVFEPAEHLGGGTWTRFPLRPSSWCARARRSWLISDRKANAELLPIPMAMTIGAVNQALVAAGRRTTGLAWLWRRATVEMVHHAAVLIGYGAGAVCPVADARDWDGSLRAAGTEPAAAEKKMLKALDAGLAKVMSKMGISVVGSYRGAHLFDILGLHADVVERCFVDTPAPLLRRWPC